jgi:hypothetical protein
VLIFLLRSTPYLLVSRNKVVKWPKDKLTYIDPYRYKHLSIYLSLYLWLYSPCGPWPLFQFLNQYTVGRTPWTGDQLFSMPLPTNRTTQPQNKTLADIHASSGIRAHDPSVLAGEDSSCFRLRSRCDRHGMNMVGEFKERDSWLIEGGSVFSWVI